MIEDERERSAIRLLAMRLTLLVVVALLTGCKDKDKDKGAGENPAPAPVAKDTAGGQPAPAASCAEQTAELRSWLTSLFDPAQAVTAPWPTGDATFDAELSTLRDKVRESAKPADPAASAAPLAEGTVAGRLESELAACPQALDQLKQVADAAPDQARTTLTGLADAIAACECRASIPRVKALLYLGQRGAE
jgi:hypothetical protein